MATTVNNQKMSIDTSSAFVLGMEEVSLTPVKSVLRFELLELLDEWHGHVRFPLENFLDQEQTEIERRFALPQRLTDPLYGRDELNRMLQEMATNAPTIESIWEITERLPSLSELLSEERDNE